MQDTLNACSTENVEQMEQALDTIYRQHKATSTIIGLTTMPCGSKAAFATKGYFAKQSNRRGRQLGRVLASPYHEVVVDRLFDGKMQLTRALQPLLLAAERTLQLDEDKTSSR
jgi:hypothetical protein